MEMGSHQERETSWIGRRAARTSSLQVAGTICAVGYGCRWAVQRRVEVPIARQRCIAFVETQGQHTYGGFVLQMCPGVLGSVAAGQQQRKPANV
jgi:hypothetical protein